MGSNKTFVDGVRRLFQRRSTSSSSSVNDNTNDQKNTHLTVSNIGPKIVETEEEGLKITEDFDFSGLSVIKVPKRVTLVMDPHKKVCFLIFLLWV